MNKTLKRFLSLCLVLVSVLCVFSGCGGNGDTGTTTEPAVTEPAAEAKILKVLTLGHSLAVDCGHMLNMIAATEGTGDYEEIVIGTLYYAGCPLNKHVQYLQSNSPEYKLYMSSSKTPDAAPAIMDGVTMQTALKYDYWDIIVMQGGVFEITEPSTFTNGNIQTIQNYVNQNKRNPLAVFAWHMPWASPLDNTLRDTYPNTPNSYYTSYEKYNNDRTTFYNGITKCVSDHILTDETFQFVIPTGTAMENALSSYLEETDLHRDYAHATDLARVMVSYVWYCKLMGIEKLERINLDTIPVKFFKSTQGVTDRVLTDAEKDIILESVNNALANPLQMTQSQYTQAPAA